MAIVAKAATTYGLCDSSVHNKLCALLRQFSLPVTTDMSAAQLYTSALSDKKRSGGIVNLIVPRSIGNCEILPTPIDKLESFLKAGL